MTCGETPEGESIDDRPDCTSKVASSVIVTPFDGATILLNCGRDRPDGPANLQRLASIPKSVPCRPLPNVTHHSFAPIAGSGPMTPGRSGIARGSRQWALTMWITRTGPSSES